CSPAPLPELRDRFGAVPDHTKRAIVAPLLCSVVGLVSVYVPVLTNLSRRAITSRRGGTPGWRGRGPTRRSGSCWRLRCSSVPSPCWPGSAIP
ncbi:MAG: hypothetical protein AVDCRST_MAG02-4912, partial [uncultured Rubrobacteraceae bacterium]